MRCEAETCILSGQAQQIPKTRKRAQLKQMRLQSVLMPVLTLCILLAAPTAFATPLTFAFTYADTDTGATAIGQLTDRFGHPVYNPVDRHRP